jgi:hypothetical protein
MVALLAAGAGHGTYIPAKVIFPYTMLLALAFEEVTVPLMVLAVVQFPLYGLVVGMAYKWGKPLIVAFLLGLVHALAVCLCFFLALSTF